MFKTLPKEHRVTRTISMEIMKWFQKNGDRKGFLLNGDIGRKVNLINLSQ